jgi:cell division protein FtsB
VRTIKTIAAAPSAMRLVRLCIMVRRRLSRGRTLARRPRSRARGLKLGLGDCAALGYPFPVQQLRTRRRRNPEVWLKANRLVATLIALGLVAIAVLAFHPEWERHQDLAARLEEEQAVLREQELLLQQRDRELHLLQHDPEYVENLARDTLGLMKEGEEIIRLDPATLKPSTVRALPAATP